MADSDIHCNVIKCRKPLSIEIKACVTSCSHIFCLDCANSLFSKSLTCPACNTTLSQESDDIILIHLNPTEEYKSSVLAGLKPDIILDICSRAIAFYEYQTSQELAFRSVLQKNTQEKYNSLKRRFDVVSRDINHLIKVEKEKHKAIMSDYELEKKQSHQLYKKYEEKTKQFQKLKVMYEKLKRKSIAPNMQESFSTTLLQQQQQQQQHMSRPTTLSNNNHHLIGYHNQSSILHQRQQYPTDPSLMIFNNENDDLLPRIEKSSTITRSVFIPPLKGPLHLDRNIINNNNYPTYKQQQQQIIHPRSSSTRIPSPVKSVFSVRGNHHHHHQKIYKKPNSTKNNNSNNKKQQQQQQEKNQYQHHQHHSNAPSEP